MLKITTPDLKKVNAQLIYYLYQNSAKRRPLSSFFSSSELLFKKKIKCYLKLAVAVLFRRDLLKHGFSELLDNLCFTFVVLFESSNLVPDEVQ